MQGIEQWIELKQEETELEKKKIASKEYLSGEFACHDMHSVPDIVYTKFGHWKAKPF